MYQYWKEEGNVEIEEQHLARQFRSILKTEKLSKVEIEALSQKLTAP